MKWEDLRLHRWPLVLSVGLALTFFGCATTSQVRVTTEDLRVLATVSDLTMPELALESAVLTSVPSGARVLWQVEATLPGGENVASETFNVTLELVPMALTVVDRQRVENESVTLRHRRRGVRVEPAAQQHDGAPHYTPRVFGPQTYL